MADKKNENSIGALWEKDGGKWFSGQIEINGEKTNIVVFKNDYKKEDKHPDWKILKSVPKEDRQKKDEQPEETQGLNPPGMSEEETEDLPF